MTRPSAEALERLSQVAVAYRQAFDDVQRALGELDAGQMPRWAFAVDRMPIDDMRDHAPELARAEQLRRRWRVALHAMAELVALGECEVAPLVAERARADLDRPSLDEVDRARLDRFISVIDQAREGGCIYLNGTFQPVDHTPRPAPRRRSGPGR